MHVGRYSVPATTKGKRLHPLAIKAKGCTALRRRKGEKTRQKKEKKKKRERRGERKEERNKGRKSIRK
jgi:hypothetical protein